ncbi:CDP-diacylglycerol--glycerol-3-phosphate 3-phosphatidyltransferase [Collimonas pratensis]|uniref:CDP-diacylglycerol--glycerol-3-phosphate 3-phosphatidyltransferase n=1 Tax=Collimonas pratensis TaxID=279113 RepID=A0A127Q205_9BURK|nr:CDP-diacylglycerol--glycerol-3-phosphate 3-phosphatidyltransferase [Collimonas pratensis]AMP04064.1 CDP-diacylglycerol--glycerol-3-phosphate 3-phosphatidyltransferase [Collimonas pratensis]AMP14003.1 CDP-diacylglycerol--glycerol-3-phosphate 3-phosphatidyltransferase [Collimonas pratensis]NKI68603.1 CDP-diacylglycerol--glycerol-3-phosphate 3-phosphatidyltransferase [Collimonas pratensis]
MPFNIPILLTWLRVALIPLVVGVFYLPDLGFTTLQLGLASTIIFIVAAVTDWFDGFLARRWNQTSAFGAFLDPVADKLMVAGALLVLVHLGRVDPIIAFVIIGREIAISALREWMAQIGASKSVAVSSIGKIKTTAQMVAIPMLLYYGDLFGIDTRFWGQVLLLIAAVLTVWSMFYYLRKAWPLIKESTAVSSENNKP